MESLGRTYDLVACIAPKDLQDNAHNTGVRVSLKDCESVDFVLYKGAGTAAQDPQIDIQQANAATGGLAKDLDCIAHFFAKSETTLDGDEVWTEYTQTKASEVALGTATTNLTAAEEEGIYVFHVEASAMDFAGGYYWAFVYIADVGANAQLGCVLAIRTGLLVQQKATSLRNPNA